MLRVLLDEGLPLRAAQWLRDHAIEAIHTREAGLASAPDAEILAAARAEGRICFTLDHDFHAILAETGAAQPSVVLIRMQHEGYLKVGILIERVLADIGSQLEAGVAATVTRRGLRLRSLPLK